MLDYVTDFTRKPVPGPYQGSGRSHFIFTKGGSALLGLPGYAMLYSVEVATGGTPGTLTIYNGIDATGDVVAKIDLSQKVSYLYGGLYCAAGMYVEIDTAATVSVAIVYDGANPKVLTVSGNEITDPVRASSLYWSSSRTGDMTDGLGYALVKNLVTNGGFEKDTSGWAGLNTGTISRDSTHAKYGLQALKVVAAAAGDGAIFGGGAVAVVSPQTYTFSAYVYSVAGGGEVAQLFWDENIAGAYNNTKSGTTTVLSAGWNLVTLTAATAATVDTINIYMEMNVATTVWMDGVQVEAGPTANGYVDTNGIVATGLVGSGDKSYGIFRAATNLFRHGQCEAITGFAATSGGTTGRAIDSTTPAPFSPQSIKCTPDGTSANQGVKTQSFTGLALAAGTNCSTSIYFKGQAGLSYTATSWLVNTDTTSTLGTDLSFVATGSWQLVVPAGVTVGTGLTGDLLQIRVTVTGTRSDTFWVAHPMLESGQSVVAPYVATSGGVSATHAAGRVQAPASMLTAAQGWVAMKVRPRWAAAATDNNHVLFSWSNGTLNERIQIFYSVANSVWSGRRRTGGLGSDPARSPGFTNAGDTVLVILSWTATTFGISVNGNSFAPVANTSIPVGLQSTFSLGSDADSEPAAGLEFNGDFLWTACGVGTLTDSDAASINALGSTDPNLHSFPDAAQASMIWPCISTDYLTPF